MPDKKAVGKKDCAEWVTKRIPFSGAFFSLFSAVTTNIFQKRAKLSLFKWGKWRRKLLWLLKKWSESQSPAQKIIFYSNKGQKFKSTEPRIQPQYGLHIHTTH